MLFDGGSLTVGGVTFKNAGGASYGALALPRALQVSSDVFFYRLGLMADQRGGDLIQKWARRLGLGHPTGIDLPGEVAGLVPTPGVAQPAFRKHLTDRPWSAGDNVNLAVGQGDLQADPLQMAVAYSAIANGGRVVTPHIGLRVEDADGRILQEISPGRAAQGRHLAAVPATAIMSGLRAAANDPGGTSAPVFDGFPITVAGKTGTAERGAQGDQSWYVVAGALQRPARRRRGDDRARRLRRRGGGPRRAPDPRRLLRDQGQEGGRLGGERTELMRRRCTQPSPDSPFGTGAQRASEPRQRLLPARLPAAARRPWRCSPSAS